MSGSPDSVSLPWARWVSVPFALFSTAMAGSFWHESDNPFVYLWFLPPAALAYFALALLFNRTVIRVDNGFIRVKHWPVPWPGKRVPVADVTGIRVHARQAKDASSVSWELEAVLRGGKAIGLIWGPIAGHRHDLLDKAAQALAADLGVPVL